MKGLTREHCVRTVTEKVSKLEGVDGVEVDLTSGGVTVSNCSPRPAARVATAVDDAGCELVG